MIKVTKTVLGFDVEVEVANTLAELANLCGSEERVVDLCNAQITAHSHFGKLRRDICATIEKLSGIERVKATKDTRTEREEVYITRVEAEKGKDWMDSIHENIMELSKSSSVDYTVKPREIGSKKPTKKSLEAYDMLLKAGRLDEFVAKHGIDVSSCDAEEAKSLIVEKIRQIILERERELQKSVMAAL